MDQAIYERSYAEISVPALCENYKRLRAHIPKSAKIMSVVKADAYGHGAAAIAPALEKLGSDAFAVSNITEAEELRAAGVRMPILILGVTPAAFIQRLCRGGISATVTDLRCARELSAAAAALGETVGIHIKAETGMGRLGLPAHSGELLPSALAEILEITRLPGLNTKGLFTHFATADEGDPALTRRQFELFCALAASARSAGADIPLIHCSNSAACLKYPEMSLDMVRPGIALYGLSPDSAEGSPLTDACPLEPVMSLKSNVFQVKGYLAGDTISYGAHALSKDSEIAVVAIGYADGYPRCVSGCGEALIAGKPAPVVGRVCMDMTMFDVTGASVRAGDRALLFGREDGVSLPVERLAAAAGTVNYEIVCRVGHRVPRVYVRG